MFFYTYIAYGNTSVANMATRSGAYRSPHSLILIFDIFMKYCAGYVSITVHHCLTDMHVHVANEGPNIVCSAVSTLVSDGGQLSE